MKVRHKTETMQKERKNTHFFGFLKITQNFCILVHFEKKRQKQNENENKTTHFALIKTKSYQDNCNNL